MTPFFSIIVVALNAEQFIGDTIESIKMQTFDNYEVIVKDGGSEDKTLSFVPDDDYHFRVFRIPDKSLYEAMNQAIEKSTGKYLIFMNCGDVFAEKDVLDKIKTDIGNDEYVLYYGDYSRDGILHKQPDRLTSFYMYRTPLCHQTIFFNGEKLRLGEKYNISYKILADYDLELRLIKQGKVGHSSVVICMYQGGGISESKVGIKKKEIERKIILKSTFSLLQRMFFGIRFHASMPKIRTYVMYSEKTPKWIKKLYQSIVNKLN